MKRKLLQDEIATAQDRALMLMEQDIWLSDTSSDEQDEPSWGSDPFDILAKLEEEQGHPISHH